MDSHHTYWEENSNIQHLKYESCNSNDGDHPRLKDEPLYRCCDSNLNFATVACSEDDSEYSQYKKSKVSRQDPMSHRIIEKRRRDRMNNCLADLSRLIPAEYLKKGRGRIEKTEIIEMAIKHIKYLQQAHRTSGREEQDRSHGHEQYRMGYQECMSETMRFLVEVEGYFAREALCVRLINHLQKHCDSLLIRERVNSASTKLQAEKDYNSQTMPILISPTPTINNPTCVQSPVHPIPDQFDSASHLRDMLTGTIKDEIQPLQTHPISRDDLPPLTSSPNHENLDQNHYKPILNNLDCQEIHDNVNQIKLIQERSQNLSENDYSNGVSLYKFKNNIKQRFSQDLSAESKILKRRKVNDSLRRNSIATETYSSENHSSPVESSQGSPPSSETYRLSSESETARISPTGSSVSDIRTVDSRTRYMKPENNYKSHGFGQYSPKHNYDDMKNNLPPADNEKNFSVPIFALHAKGAFYIPLTIDYNTLVPFLQHHNSLDMLPNVHNIILHPVTINVNFQSNYFSTTNQPIVKITKHKMSEEQNGWH